jgi:hypothetical protein
MDKRNFISVTLLISALALNPLIATELNINNLSTQRQINTVTNSIASLLYNRGLDEDVAHNLSRELVDDKDELFEAMINNIVNIYQDITHEEILEHLSTLALHRQNIDFASYDHLVHMVTKIKSKALSQTELKQLSTVSKLNQMIYV